MVVSRHQEERKNLTQRAQSMKKMVLGQLPVNVITTWADYCFCMVNSLVDPSCKSSVKTVMDFP